MSECRLSGNCCRGNVSVDYLEITLRKIRVCECGLFGGYFADNKIVSVYYP